MEKAPDSSSPRQLKEGMEVSLEPVPKVDFSSKQSAYHRDTPWGDSFWTPTVEMSSRKFLALEDVSLTFHADTAALSPPPE